MVHLGLVLTHEFVNTVQLRAQFNHLVVFSLRLAVESFLHLLHLGNVQVRFGERRTPGGGASHVLDLRGETLNVTVEAGRLARTGGHHHILLRYLAQSVHQIIVGPLSCAV
ncbi:hypothetical protein AGDE_13267 [Angomonas deanei]|uniref:Uncharacterized protein n=1 Tax=Angomonas deanei TaxID=59799 RepID=A0A7G2CI88_9TRYP|nr:hypothetical protein AGDE_13267 [Angomonas deanei]CAD2217952.1 hypothetical protein, conserved [Angomonas deanei]|eukprot:EPY22522.1 hypothetical protein AGDE_13267 [Angomonas deanei]